MIDFTSEKPLYKQIADDIEQQISNGRLKVGDQLPTHKVLADKYNVSLITVKQGISDLVSKNILFSRQGRGTFIAQKPNTINFSKNIVIGLVLQDLQNPFFSRIVESVEKYLSKKGYNLLVSTSAKKTKREDSLIQHYLDMGVSGLIIASLTHEYHATTMIRKLHEMKFPYSMVSYVVDDDINYVGTDHKYGAYIATQHLIKCGDDSIGYLGDTGNLLSGLRLKGYLSALEDNNIQPSQEYIYSLDKDISGDYYDAGYRFGLEFVNYKKRPKALFVYNDLLALGFERAVLDKGMKVPEDISIVGFDGIKRGLIAQVPLTTIVQPTNDIGKEAVEMVLDLMKNKSTTTRRILKPELLIRNSCGKIIFD